MYCIVRTNSVIPELCLHTRFAVSETFKTNISSIFIQKLGRQRRHQKARLVLHMQVGNVSQGRDDGRGGNPWVMLRDASKIMHTVASAQSSRRCISTVKARMYIWSYAAAGPCENQYQTRKKDDGN